MYRISLLSAGGVPPLTSEGEEIPGRCDSNRELRDRDIRQEQRYCDALHFVELSKLTFINYYNRAIE